MVRLLAIFLAGLLVSCAARHPANYPYPQFSPELGTTVAVVARHTIPMCSLCVMPETDGIDRTPAFGYQCEVGSWGQPLIPYGPVTSHDKASRACDLWLSTDRSI